jgi:hypothetical protein
VDRLEQMKAARALAQRIVASDGTDGDARLRFYEEAGSFSLLGASERRRIWNEAGGIDDRTGLPLT